MGVNSEEKMDILTGLNALGQATAILKEIRGIEQNLDAATYKIKIAELYENLSDAKMSLTDAREALHSKDQEIKALQAQIKSLKSGENCPLCSDGTLKVTAQKPHPSFSFAGVQEQTLTCQNSTCNHSEKRLYDPTNVMNK